MRYEHHTNNDAVAVGLHPTGSGGRAGGAAGVFLEVLQKGLHPTPARRHPGAEDLPQGRLPGHRRTPPRLVRSPRRAGTQEGAALHHPPEGPRGPQKKHLDALVRATAAPAPRPPADRPAPVEPVRAAVDSTGYDARPVSRYFVVQCGRPTRQKRWPKLTAVVDTRTHLFLSASVTRAPRQDAPQLVPVVRQAV